MGWRSIRTRTAIGLDVGARWFHAVQLCGKPGAWRVAAATSVPRDEESSPVTPTEIRRLCEVMSRQGFAGRKVVLAAPADKLISTILELPPRDSGAPVEQIARMELASMHRLDPSALELSYWDLPESTRQRETPRVMAAACVHQDADEYLNHFESQGLEVAALDTATAATARMCDLSGASRQGIVPVLDLGWQSARLAVLYQGVMIYERQLTDAGIQSLWQTLCERLDVDADVVDYLLNEVGLSDDENTADTPYLEDLHTDIREHFEDSVRELSISFSYALHQYSDTQVQALRLVGGGAAIPGLGEHMTTMLGSPVRVVSVAEQIECGQALRHRVDTPVLCQATGLALHGQKGGGA